MSEVKKIATRESYGKALVELGGEHSNLVVLDADLAAATKTGMFRKAFPDRHFDCGIAEENMIAVAAGLSTMGLVPFASSFAMFAAVLAEKCPTAMRRIGVNDEFGHSGPAWEVLRQFGLCADHIVEVAEDFVQK